MKKLTNKKAFTLTEIIVVIVIIGILASVIITGYTGYISKANKTNDISIVKQMNDHLAIQKAVDGKNVTYTDMKQDLRELGIVIDELKPRSKEYKFAWDSKLDRIVMLDESNKVVEPSNQNGAEVTNKDEYFIVAQNLEAFNSLKLTGYSIYLGKGFTSDTPLTVNSGIDTGENGVSVKYVNTTGTKKTTTIRTNGGDLEIEAPLDTVNHYGRTGLLNVVAVDKNSFHEYGDSSMVKISAGRVVFESTSSTNVVYVESNDAVVAVATSVETPTINRSDAVSSFVIQTVENNSGKKVTETSVEITGSTVTTTTKDSTDKIVEAPNNVKLEEVKNDVSNSVLSETIESSYKPIDIKNIVDLENSVKQGYQIIRFTRDITINEPLRMDDKFFSSDKKITIDGNGFSLKGSRNRVIRIGSNDKDIEFRNLSIESICTDDRDVRGVSFDANVSNVTVIFDNCSISASFYAINCCGGTSNLNVTVKNGTVVTGWAAFNSFSNDSTFTFENSVLKGLNDKTESEWNNFATLVFDGDYKQYGSNNTLNINNCTIFALSDNNNKQAWLLVQRGAENNSIIVDGKTVITDGVNDQSNYISHVNNEGKANEIVINGIAK